MQCERCQQAPATTHVKRTVGGHTTELHLCAACAAQQGVPNLLSGPLELSHFWSSLFTPQSPTSAPVQEQAEPRCPGCGASFAELAQSGQAGCPACYTTFRERLLPSLQRLHGKTGHMGKVPARFRGEEGDAPATDAAGSAQALARLRRELSDCIAAQQYETCAALRDRIRALEQAEKEG